GSPQLSGPRAPPDHGLCEPRGCARRGAHGPGGVRPDRGRAVLVSADSGREPAASRLLSTAWHQTSDLDADGLRRTRRLPRGDDRVRYLGRTAGPGWWNPPRDGKRASMPPTPPPDGGFASTGSSSVPSPP